jgi:hypothetical protein
VKKDLRLMIRGLGEGPWRAAADLPREGAEAAVTAYFRGMYADVLTEPIPQPLLDAIEPLRGREL